MFEIWRRGTMKSFKVSVEEVARRKVKSAREENQFAMQKECEA